MTSFNKNDNPIVEATGVEAKIPKGWVFSAADFSLKAAGKRKMGNVTFVRDVEGRKKWLSLSEEDRDRVHLYVSGSGVDLESAIEDAVNRISRHINDVG
jgi:hypothetical protein